MTLYTRTYNPQPTQRVGSTDLKNEFQAVEAGFTAAEAASDRSLRQSGGSAVNALPSAASRALKVLSFDADGHPRTTITETDLSAAVTAASNAAASASSASASVTAAADQVALATTQAGIATTKAAEAAASAASVAGGPVVSVNGLTGIVTLPPNLPPFDSGVI